jgi:iron complex outermembrane receptor protein
MKRAKKTLHPLILSLTLLPAYAVYAEDEDDYLSMDVESLMDLEIVSSHKTPEKLFTTTAPIYVITQEDIKRSAAERVEDLLVRVPGLFVQQLTRHRNAISIRNDDTFFTATLLVLIDGVAVYNPANGGVVWAFVDAPLQDIERIEVIRGSGGITWGANASTGIINIITKKAKDTDKFSLTAAAGTEGRFDVTLQGSYQQDKHGIKATLHTNSDKGFDYIDISDVSTQKVFTSRYDYDGEDWHTRLSLASQVVELEDFNPFIAQVKDSIGHSDYFDFSTERKFSDGSLFVFKTHFGNLDSPQLSSGIQRLLIKTSDIESQYHHQWSDESRTYFAANFRSSDLSISDAFNPPNNQIDQTAFSLNHQMKFGEFKFEIGSRAEHNSNVEKEWHISPATRLSYQASDSLFFWGSATKSFQFPTYIQQGIKIKIGEHPSSKLDIFLKGNDKLRAEEIIDYQLGLRFKSSEDTLIDFNVYYSESDNIIADDLADIFFNNFELFNQYNNLLRHQTQGLELSLQKFYSEKYQTQFNLTYYKKNVFLMNSSKATGINLGISTAPNYKISWLNTAHFSSKTYLFGELTWVDNYFSEEEENIKQHFRLDIKLNHQYNSNVDIAIMAKNIFNNELEANSEFVIKDPQKVEPSYQVQVKYKID